MFKELIAKQKCEGQQTQKMDHQKFDILEQLKAFKSNDSNNQQKQLLYFRQNKQIKIKQLDLPKLMKRIYSEKKLKVNSQQEGKQCEKAESSLSKSKLPPRLLTSDRIPLGKPKLTNVASTDRISTECKERKDYLNYTFGTQFRLRTTNISHSNSKSMMGQKRSTSQTSRIMTTSQQRVINKIFQ
ncbi:unnamed protein product (macronuclear) [Paramecium tetraurelia]|uniref:Uncharacterized protein n=1 Tax=Paramecium tetraurelia TaxID=5888 RepID=A0CXX2_PARTE|nr:uncharacterized protein GSPATT00011271001 [Paramecium tetraurelia]CAK75639.1 unnamed protein product [Paramecium tetraurelia]|eukprot:XP_001443036.1 hypothetical protein (macronuclear) [Paramecium tetraurelia strain d4-2]